MSRESEIYEIDPKITVAGKGHVIINFFQTGNRDFKVENGEFKVENRDFEVAIASSK